MPDDYKYHFKSSEVDSVDEAFNELKEDDIKYEEIQWMRLKFLSDFALEPHFIMLKASKKPLFERFERRLF